jgi:hypothetical protein
MFPTKSSVLGTDLGNAIARNDYRTLIGLPMGAALIVYLSSGKYSVSFRIFYITYDHEKTFFGYHDDLGPCLDAARLQNWATESRGTDARTAATTRRSEGSGQFF